MPGREVHTRTTRSVIARIDSPPLPPGWKHVLRAHTHSHTHGGWPRGGVAAPSVPMMKLFWPGCFGAARRCSSKAWRRPVTCGPTRPCTVARACTPPSCLAPPRRRTGAFTCRRLAHMMNEGRKIFPSLFLAPACCPVLRAAASRLSLAHSIWTAHSLATDRGGGAPVAEGPKAPEGSRHLVIAYHCWPGRLLLLAAARPSGPTFVSLET